jgi:hypothetical protein
LTLQIKDPAAAATAHGVEIIQRTTPFNKVRVPTQEYIDRLEDIANWKDRLRLKIARELDPFGFGPDYASLREEIGHFKLACRCLMVRP